MFPYYYPILLQPLPFLPYHLQYKPAMKARSSFEAIFFQYQLPLPYQSYYSREYCKSNDLRLLVEIGTRSALRMFTDAKTGVLHFICKCMGQDCLDVQAYYHQRHQGYYFQQDITTLKHKHRCALQGAPFRYLQIYNLLKMKKDLIEGFMIKNNLMNESPSLILSKLSNNQEQEYFFEKYINHQVEARRKLRKRFDNVVNIDIKKIGKNNQEVEEKEPKNKTRINQVKLGTIKEVLAMSRKQNPSKKQKEQEIYQQEEEQVQIKEEANNVYQEQVKQQITQTPVANCSQQRITDQLADIMSNALQVYNQLKSNKKKRIAKTTKKRTSNNRFRQTRTEVKNQRQRQSIFLLPDDNSSQGQEYFINSKPPESLAQLKMLNQEQAEYLWSSSQSASQSVNNPFQHIEINQEDYFKSLRNSTLKKSLEKESLTSFLFSSDPFRKENNI